MALHVVAAPPSDRRAGEIIARPAGGRGPRPILLPGLARFRTRRPGKERGPSRPQGPRSPLPIVVARRTLPLRRGPSGIEKTPAVDGNPWREA